MPNDILLPQLVLNKMTREQFEEAKAGGAISPTEMYLVDDVESGGSGEAEEKWELIGEMTVEEEVKEVLMNWEPMKKVRCEVYTPSTAGDTNYMPITVDTGYGFDFYVGRFYPTALPQKNECRVEYRISMEEYNGEIIMRYTENNAVVRDGKDIKHLVGLKEATSNGNSYVSNKFTNKFITGIKIYTYGVYPIGSTFKFWGVKA